MTAQRTCARVIWAVSLVTGLSAFGVLIAFRTGFVSASGSGRPRNFTFSGWNIGSYHERLGIGGGDVERERTGLKGLHGKDDMLHMFGPLVLAEQRVVDSRLNAPLEVVSGIIHKAIKPQYIPHNLAEVVTVHQDRRALVRVGGFYAYQCRFVDGGNTRNYRILFFQYHVRPIATRVYIDGLSEMKTSKNVEARIREIFNYTGNLVSEKPLVPNPLTFKVRSENGKWQFRGGKTTLVSPVDTPTTCVVDALAAEIRP